MQIGCKRRKAAASVAHRGAFADVVKRQNVAFSIRCIFIIVSNLYLILGESERNIQKLAICQMLLIN